jgi:hypothetical protein
VAIVRGIAVLFDGGSECCCAVEVAMEEGTDPLQARTVQACDHPPVTTWLGAGLCADHRDQLRVNGRQ